MNHINIWVNTVLVGRIEDHGQTNDEVYAEEADLTEKARNSGLTGPVFRELVEMPAGIRHYTNIGEI